VVLVLDPGIQSCSVKAPVKEQLFRVVTSGWAQRMWTLQEGLLAERLVFEFTDGLMSVEELLTSSRRLVFDPVVRLLLREMEQLTGPFLRESPAMRFGYISSANDRTGAPHEDPLAQDPRSAIEYSLSTRAEAERCGLQMGSEVVHARG